MNEAYDLHPSLMELAPDVPDGSILSRTFYKDERLSAVIFSFAEGEELSEHTSTYPAIIQILGGRARLKLGEEWSTVEAGAWIRMAAQLPHTVIAETPVTMLLLMLK